MKKYLQILKKYWLKFASILAAVNARIILTLLYFVIFPFFAIPYKIALLFQKNKQSNWKKYDRTLDLTEQF